MKVTLTVEVEGSEEMGWTDESAKEVIEEAFSGFGDVSVRVTIVDTEEE